MLPCWAIANLTTVSSFFTSIRASPTKKSSDDFGGVLGIVDAAGFRIRCARVRGRTVFAGGAFGVCAISSVEAQKSNAQEVISFIFLIPGFELKLRAFPLR